MEISEQIDKFKEFIDMYYQMELAELVSTGGKALVVDFSKLVEFDIGLAEDLLEDPEDTIKASELAIEQVDIVPEDMLLHVRFKNLPESQELRICDVRSIHLGKFVSMEAIVRQASDIRPQVTNAKFECAGCGNTLSILQVDTKFKEPSRCTCGWRGRFRLLSQVLVDVQHLKVEEAPESLEGGEQPKRLSVFLKEDLVDPKMEKKSAPGNRIRIVGIIKEIPITLKTGARSVRYDLVVEANNLEAVHEEFSDVLISADDESEIKEFSKDPQLFDKFVRSMAPSIYGHEKLKEALLLQMLGGIKRIRPDGTARRGDIHVLFVGDPGSGKSALLQFVAKAAPKARFVSGKGATGAGITAAVVKDEFLKGWSLEAGALVLANKGICVVDELDKMGAEDRSALHEALEQQTVSISKANIQACYSSDTEVLTDKGWLRYQDVKSAKLAQYNSQDGTVQFLSHKGLYVYDYNGKMYHFKNRRNDILVTPNHKMLAREYSQKEYRAIEAKDLKYDYIKFLNSGKFVGEEEKYFILPPIKHKQNRKHPKYVHQHVSKKIPMDIWLEFLGYYLSEGGIQAELSIGIVQKVGKDHDKIKKCLLKLSKLIGFTLSQTKEGPYTRFQITSTQLFRYLEKHCGKNCYEKKYPLELLINLSKRQLEILYDAMMLGDGSADGKSYGSTSKELIDLFHIAAFLIGKSTSQHIQYGEKYRGNRKTMYRVVLSNRTQPSIRKKSIKIVNYKGKVFCFATKTGFFVTRRNGKVAVQGNTLRAETTMLAAANPKLGRFDPYSPIATQIDLPSTLLNRFDLIFIVRDMPNRERDSMIATHVLETTQSGEAYKTEVSTEFFRKYLAYVKKNVFPSVTKGAINEIRDFYVQLRNSGKDIDEGGIKPIPISARQLEALIRMSEASARLRLDTQVTREDAKRAIEMLRYCLLQVGVDPETKQIDIDRMYTGVSASQRGKIVAVKEILTTMENKGVKSIAVEDIISEAAGKGIEESKVYDIIDQLKRSGDVFEPRKGFIQRI